ncbi:hypothetical protein ACLOJK_017859 [Asimina triloba]
MVSRKGGLWETVVGRERGLEEMTVGRGADDGRTVVSRRGDGGRQERRRGGNFDRRGASIAEEEGDRLRDSIAEEEGDGAAEQKRREMAGQKRRESVGKEMREGGQNPNSFYVSPLRILSPMRGISLATNANESHALMLKHTVNPQRNFFVHTHRYGTCGRSIDLRRQATLPRCRPYMRLPRGISRRPRTRACTLCFHPPVERKNERTTFLTRANDLLPEGQLGNSCGRSMLREALANYGSPRSREALSFQRALYIARSALATPVKQSTRELSRKGPSESVAF